MRCSEARRLCSVYLDRDLTFEEQSEFRRHLDGCPECAEELRQMQECVALLQSLPETDPGPEFCEAVCRKAREAEATGRAGGRVGFSLAEFFRARFSTPVLRPVMIAAAWLVMGVVLGGGSVYFAWNQGGDDAIDLAESSGGGATQVESGLVRVESAALQPESEAASGPFADLDLSHLWDAAESQPEPEYMLEPYVADPQRGLVPAGMEYGRGASGDWDTQNDVYITF